MCTRWAKEEQEEKHEEREKGQKQKKNQDKKDDKKKNKVENKKKDKKDNNKEDKEENKKENIRPAEPTRTPSSSPSSRSPLARPSTKCCKEGSMRRVDERKSRRRWGSEGGGGKVSTSIAANTKLGPSLGVFTLMGLTQLKPRMKKLMS